MSGSDTLDDSRDRRIFWSTASRKVRKELRVGKVQNRFENRQIPFVERGGGREKRLQDGVELPHPATAAPTQLRNVGRHQGSITGLGDDRPPLSSGVPL